MQVVEEGKVGIQGALNAKEGKGPAAVSALQSAGMQPDWLLLFTCKHGSPAVWLSQWVTAMACKAPYSADAGQQLVPLLLLSCRRCAC